MALPPYLMTKVLPWNLRMYGRACARISAELSVLMGDPLAERLVDISLCAQQVPVASAPH